MSYYNSIKNYQLLQNKSNKRFLRPLRDIKDNLSNGEEYCVHGLEHSILKICNFFPNLFIDSCNLIKITSVYGTWQTTSKIYIDVQKAKSSQGAYMNSLGLL